MKLYEIAAEYQSALDALATDEHLSAETISDSLAGIDEAFEQKAVNVGKYCQSIKRELAAVSAEIERLGKRAATLENAEGRMREYLIRNMQALGKTRIDDALLPLKLVNNPPRLDVPVVEAVPPQYMKEKTVLAPDKPRIKQELSDGTLTANWASIVHSQRIKIG